MLKMQVTKAVVEKLHSLTDVTVELIADIVIDKIEVAIIETALGINGDPKRSISFSKCFTEEEHVKKLLPKCADAKNGKDVMDEVVVVLKKNGYDVQYHACGKFHDTRKNDVCDLTVSW